MTNELTYSLIYTPELSRTSIVNYVCSDDKIHIRFRDFNKPQIVKGFEKKLTYLMAYLMNFSYITKLFDICDQKTIINALLDAKDVKLIYNVLHYDRKIDFKAFKLTCNYNKKEKCVAFGEVDQGAFPLEYDEFGNVKEATLEIFLKKLKLNLLEFLFNDGYSILIHEKEVKDINTKFINKELRKASKPSTDFVDLW